MVPGCAGLDAIEYTRAGLDPHALFATTLTVPDTNPDGKQMLAIDLVVVNGFPEPGVPPGLVTTHPAGAVIVHDSAS